MTMATNDNGRARKSLASQLDRLDGILDGLAEALNGAVAEAVRGTVEAAMREAVQATLIAALTDSGVRGRLAALCPPTSAEIHGQVPCPDKAPGHRCGRARDGMGPVLAMCAYQKRLVRSACSNCFRRLRTAKGWVVHLVRALWRWKYAMLTALGVGVVAGATSYCSGPYVAGTVGCLAGCAATLATQVGLALRRSSVPCPTQSPALPERLSGRGGHKPDSSEGATSLTEPPRNDHDEERPLKGAG
jgi:hypothetical protein